MKLDSAALERLWPTPENAGGNSNSEDDNVSRLWDKTLYAHVWSRSLTAANESMIIRYFERYLVALCLLHNHCHGSLDIVSCDGGTAVERLQVTVARSYPIHQCVPEETHTCCIFSDLVDVCVCVDEHGRGRQCSYYPIDVSDWPDACHVAQELFPFPSSSATSP